MCGDFIAWSFPLVAEDVAHDEKHMRIYILAVMEE
jgi:hypothetical protein